MAQLAQYQANNNNKVPAASTAGYTTFITNYLKAGGDTFTDPSTGSDYTIANYLRCTSSSCVNKTTSSSAMGAISVYDNATCEGENPKYVQGNNKIAITLNLEGAGIYCGHN